MAGMYLWSFLLDTVLALLYAATVVACVVVVLSENRNPIRSLAWIIALIFLPGVGLLFYIFFGRSLKGMHMLSRHNKRKLLSSVNPPRVDMDSLGLPEQERQLVKLARTICQAPLSVDNSVEIFTDGRSKFESLKRDLRRAEESILLQYYIFLDDSLGQEIADILIEKAREGVTVKVIYDHVGSFAAHNRFFRRMRDGGVDTHPFFRVTFPQLANRINWRNHRKIVVIDRKVGYIGGMNIADRYVDGSPDTGSWRDTHFRVRGDIVESLIYSFVIDWNFLKKTPTLLHMSGRSSGMSGNVGMQLVTSGPTEKRDNIALTFLKAISGARKNIYIQTPYFLPTDTLLSALEAAALSKIDVRVMIPLKSDSVLLRHAAFSYVSKLLDVGIKVYLYREGMLHAKVMIVDDTFVTAGSTNFDFRSFENNFECNLLIYDAECNRKMREIFFSDMNCCDRVIQSAWKKRPIYNRVIESVVRLFAPIL